MNNEAYYIALIGGIKESKTYSVDHIFVYTNSKILCNQMKGIYQVRKENLIPLHTEGRSIVSQFHLFTINHHSNIKRMFIDLLSGTMSNLGGAVKNELSETMSTLGG